MLVVVVVMMTAVHVLAATVLTKECDALCVCTVCEDAVCTSESLNCHWRLKTELNNQHTHTHTHTQS